MKRQGIVKRLLGSSLLKWSVMVIAVAVGGYEIWNEWGAVGHALRAIGWDAVALSLIALLVMQFGSLMQWQVLLAGLGSRLSVPTAFRIYFIGQMGKYIPGSVWMVVAQAQLAAKVRVPRQNSASASVVAMLLSLVGGLFVAMVTLPFTQASTAYLWVYLLVPPIAICMHPRVFNPLINKLLAVAKRDPLDQPVTGRTLLTALVWTAVIWIANGAQMWILADKFGAPAGRTVLLAFGGYAFAWCVGFVFVFAPVGVGPRDALIILFFAPLIGHSNAVAVTLVSRGVNTISDLVGAGAAFAIRNKPIGPEDDEPADPAPGGDGASAARLSDSSRVGGPSGQASG